MVKHPIITYRWFTNQAEEDVSFYTSVFPDSGFGNISRH